MSIEHTYMICDEEFTETLTKAKAIRKHCLDCCSGYQGEVAKCTVPKCALFPFRFGNEKGLDRMAHLEEGYIDPDKDESSLDWLDEEPDKETFEDSDEPNVEDDEQQDDVPEQVVKKVKRKRIKKK